MKICIVCDVLGKANNGTTIAAMNLIQYLLDQGDEVHVVCPDKDKKNNPNYYVVPTIWLGFIINYIVKKNNVTLAWPKKKTLKEALQGCDICHILMPFAVGQKACKIAHNMGIPVSAGFHAQAENFTSHIFMMNSKLANKLTYKAYYHGLYKYADAIHYPTQFIKDVFEKEISKTTNGYVISNGVNKTYHKVELQREKPFDTKFNILFIGRISKEKSHPILIKAVALSKYRDNIQLVFAGQGPREKQIKRLWEKCRINTPILKFYSREELNRVINSCDLYVHPSEVEIEAISCLEAITCGLVPIISNSKRSATKAFALSEMNLFQYNDPQDLTDKIDYWIEHPQEKEQYSQKYLSFTGMFEQNHCMQQMREMLIETIKNYGK